MRLINADELLNCMDERFKEKKGIVNDTLAEGFYQVDTLIKQQPTVETIPKEKLDKIFDILEKEKTDRYNEWLESSHYQDLGKYRECKYIIDIIKKELE